MRMPGRGPPPWLGAGGTTCCGLWVSARRCALCAPVDGTSPIVMPAFHPITPSRAFPWVCCSGKYVCSVYEMREWDM